MPYDEENRNKIKKDIAENKKTVFEKSAYKGTVKDKNERGLSMSNLIWTEIIKTLFILEIARITLIDEIKIILERIMKKSVEILTIIMKKEE